MELWHQEKEDLNTEDWKNLQPKDFEKSLKLLTKNKLPELIFLDNNIGDKGCKYLSEVLKINSSLQELNLIGNNIGDEGCNYLSEALKSHPSINELDLRENAIGNKGCNYLSELLKSNKSLRQLILKSNKVSNEGCKSLSEALNQNNKLQKLNLKCNYVGTEGFLPLSEILKKNTSLTVLILSSNNIGVESCKALGETLKANSSLQKIDLNKNNIGNEGCMYICEGLKVNNSVEKLKLGCTTIGNEGCRYLCETLQINNSLKYLDLQTNTIGVDGCKFLQEALKVNKSLQGLYLWSNYIGDEGCKYLSEGLKINNSLQQLNLERTNIGGEGCRFLSEALKMNNCLQELNLGSNNIGNEGCKYLSEVLKINIALQHLNLESNNIRIEGCNHLSEALKMNNSLQKLELNENKFDNNEPTYINQKLTENKSKCISITTYDTSIGFEEIKKTQKDLKILRIKNCSIKEIPIENFKNLEILDLTNNELNNEFIKLVCNFLKWNPSLKMLILQGNKTIGDKEGEELLTVLSTNINLIECNVTGTSISKPLQEEIKNQTKVNSLFNKLKVNAREIIESINHNRIEDVKDLLNQLLKKPQKNSQIIHEMLFFCCVSNRSDLCEFILSQKHVNINFLFEGGNSYLHFSVMKDNYEISKLLIEKGIDLNIKNTERKTCVDYCTSNGKCKSLFEDTKELKVVVLGKSQTGKTTLVKKILLEDNIKGKILDKFRFEKEKKTNGIKIYAWNIEFNNNIQLWDFGGQELFDATHQFFLSKNNIYLLLFNLTDESKEKELLFWLNSIQYRAPKSKVIIIGSHMDKIDPKLMREEVNMVSDRIKNLYDEVISNIPDKSNRIEIVSCSYWEIPKLNEAFPNDKIWFYPISGKEGWNIKYVKKIISGFSFNTTVRKEFIKVKNDIISIQKERLESIKLPILVREELNSIILECFNNNKDEVSRNTKLLHELGYILDFGNNYKYIIIHPEWLNNVFQSVISLNNTNQIKDGMIQIKDIMQNLSSLFKTSYQEQKEDFLKKINPSTPLLYISNDVNIHDFKLNSINFLSVYEQEYKSQHEFIIELLEEFNIIISHPNSLAQMKELKESNLKDKYLKSHINMIIPCLLNNSKPSDIDENIFNSNNRKGILGRKYYFSFIPKGIYESLLNKICKSIGLTMRFWKNGFIVTSNDSHLTLEIIGNENNTIFIQSIGKLNAKFISSFHFIIEGLFKNEYPLLWNNVKIEIYYSDQNITELKLDYEECLKKFKNKQEVRVNNGHAPFENLVPEKFEEKNRDILNISSSQLIEIRRVNYRGYREIFICVVIENGGRCVMKKFKIINKVGKSEICTKIKQSFERELEIMKKLKHPNLTRLIGSEQTVDKLNLFMDFFDYSLKEFQEDWLDRLPLALQQETQRDPLDDRIREFWWKDEEIIFISLQISNGLEYLHNQLFISHLDLKSENIFLNLKEEFNIRSKRPSLLSVHIGDFGEARQFDSLNSTENVGFSQLMVPELRRQQNRNNAPYNPFKADIYCLGVLFCEIVGNNTSLKFNLDKLTGKTKLEEIIRNCLQQDPTERNDISTIKNKLQEMNTYNP